MPKPDSIFLTWLPVLSLLITLAAVIVGPAVAYLVGRRQARVQLAIAYRNVISPMRQKWINDLRERLAEFISVAAWFYRLWYRVGETSSKAEENEKTLQLVLLRNQIELMLNPNEADHERLRKLLEDVRRASMESARTDEFPAAVQAANDCCKKILKDEWERVKSEQAAPAPNT